MVVVNGVYGGVVVFVLGGVLVCDKLGKIIGVVGVIGDISDNDVIVVMVGIEVVGFMGEV